MKKIYDRKQIQQYLKHPIYKRYFSNDFDNDVYLVDCKANEKLMNQGDEPTTLYFLVEGRCRVSAVNEKGKLFVINTIEAPDLVGEIELISEDDSFSVETIEKSKLLALPYDKCKKKLLKDNYFLLSLCELIIEKERKHALKLTQVNSFPLENRLAEFILDNQINDKINLKKTIIAESLGVSYRHLEKVMNDFVINKILKKDKFVYTIINKKKLIDLASVLDIF